MKSVQIFSFAVIALMIATSAFGNEHHNMACENITFSSDIDNCVSQKYQQSELRLKSEYLLFIARADKSYLNDIEFKHQYRKLASGTHESWLVYRDLNCQLESFEVDAESVAHETIRKSCLEKMNNERIIMLQTTLQ